MIITKYNASHYEAFFSGCGYLFDITLDGGAWLVCGTGGVRFAASRLRDVFTKLEVLANA